MAVWWLVVLLVTHACVVGSAGVIVVGAIDASIAVCCCRRGCCCCRFTDTSVNMVLSADDGSLRSNKALLECDWVSCRVTGLAAR